MSTRLPLIISGIVFSLVALLHLLRLTMHWQIIVNGQVIPMSVSFVGFIITVILALWMFTAAKTR